MKGEAEDKKCANMAVEKKEKEMFSLIVLCSLGTHRFSAMCFCIFFIHKNLNHSSDLLHPRSLPIRIPK